MISLTLLGSCSQKSGKTTADFGVVLAGISSLTGTGGGAMLWGAHESGSAFGINVNNIADDLTLDLKNGQWNFYMTAWAGGSGDLTGEVKCALTLENFEGGEAQVELSLLNATCADPAFGMNSKDNLGTTEYFPVQLTSCKNSNNLDVAGFCTIADSNRGFVNSYKINMPDFIDGDIGGDIPLGSTPLESSCISDAEAAAHQINFPNLNIPAGNGQAPFKIQIQGYFKTGCDSSSGMVVENLDKGIFVPSNGDQLNGTVKVHHGDLNPDITNIYHIVNETNACNFSNPNYISIGTGSSASPYAICTPTQFNSIGDDSTYMAANIELIKDLDFSGYIKEINEVYGAPSCGHIGNSIIPIGGCPPTAQSIFVGEFRGNNHKLKSVYIFEDDHDYIGIFREIGSGAKISDLHLENIQVEGRSEVGVLSGYINGANTIENIFINDVYVDARENAGISNVGGLSGQIWNLVNPLTNIHISRAEIEANGNNVGGITGNMDSSSIEKSSFEGVIHNENYTSNNYGGIAGSAVSVNISEVKTSGGVLGNMKFIGGLVGSGAAVTISDSYSDMFLATSETATINIGGLSGSNSSGTIDDSYFIGNITINCQANDPSCLAGYLNGDIGATITNSFAHFNNPMIATIAPADNYGGQSGAPKDYNQFSSGTFTSFSSWDVGKWKYNDGATAPRPPTLLWEDNFPSLFPCNIDQNRNTIVMQNSLGRGSSNNPVIICDHNQFSNIGSFLNLNFMQIGHVNLSHLPPVSTPPAINTGAFSGSYDGKKHLLHGGVSQNSVLFQTINQGAWVGHLYLAGMSAGNNFNTQVGIVSSENEGLIKDIQVYASVMNPKSTSGMITGFNKGTGVIQDVVIGQSQIVIDSNDERIGAIAGNNYGSIKKVRVNANFQLNDVSVSKIGGISGHNTGLIDEAYVGTYFEIIGDATEVGAISGTNLSPGIIKNALFSEYSSIYVTNAISAAREKVGGIVGKNYSGARIENSLSLGKVVYASGVTTSTEVGPITGLNSGGTLQNTYYAIKSYQEDGPSKIISAKFPYGTQTPTKCTIELFTGSGLADNDIIVITSDTGNGHTITTRVENFVASVADSFDFDTSEEFCNSIDSSGNGEVTKVTDMLNVEGTNLVGANFSDIAYYCSSQVFGGSPTQRCASPTEFDIIEDDPTGTGSSFLKQLLLSEFTNSPAPSNSPKWLMEDDDIFPSLFFEW